MKTFDEILADFRRDMRLALSLNHRPSWFQHNKGLCDNFNEWSRDRFCEINRRALYGEFQERLKRDYGESTYPFGGASVYFAEQEADTLYDNPQRRDFLGFKPTESTAPETPNEESKMTSFEQLLNDFRSDMRVALSSVVAPPWFSRRAGLCPNFSDWLEHHGHSQGWMSDFTRELEDRYDDSNYPFNNGSQAKYHAERGAGELYKNPRRLAFINGQPFPDSDPVKTDYAVSVMQAFLGGEEIEFFIRDMPEEGWHETNNPAWDWTKFNFRVKTKTFPSIDWSQVSPEYKFLVQNKDGTAYLYTEMPAPSAVRWKAFRGFGAKATAFVSYRPGTIDWKTSLVRRPEDA